MSWLDPATMMARLLHVHRCGLRNQRIGTSEVNGHRFYSLSWPRTKSTQCQWIWGHQRIWLLLIGVFLEPEMKTHTKYALNYAVRPKEHREWHRLSLKYTIIPSLRVHTQVIKAESGAEDYHDISVQQILTAEIKLHSLERPLQVRFLMAHQLERKFRRS